MKALALAVLALAACSRQDPPSAPKPQFQRFVEGMINDAPCSTIIPTHWSPSYPVPVLVDGKLRYRVFFRGWEGRPDVGVKIHDAEGDALFTPEGKILNCSRRGNEPKAYPVDNSPIADFDARRNSLYESIQEMGRLYAKGLPVGDADRERVKTFSSEFRLLAGKDLAASHRALSPEFWAWVEKNGGSAP